jgi:predicted MPP superfamily phosphohydrolase
LANQTARIVILGDIHFPWADEKALETVYRDVKLLQPTHVVQIGDLYDEYNFSKYPRNPNLITPDDELARARKMAVAMWAKIQQLAPRAKCVQLLGNHCARISKRIAEALPELSTLAKEPLQALFTFDGVETVHDATEEYFIGDVCFMHGHRSKFGDHAKYNQMSTVVGHSHQGGVLFFRNRREVYFELNAGWLGAEKAPVFKYGNQKIIRTWTLGYGVIDARGPRFVSL